MNWLGVRRMIIAKAFLTIYRIVTWVLRYAMFRNIDNLEDRVRVK